MKSTGRRQFEVRSLSRTEKILTTTQLSVHLFRGADKMPSKELGVT